MSTDLRVLRGAKDRPPPTQPPMVTPTDPRLIVFLEALPLMDDAQFCWPPGLGGGWRVKHIRSGLQRGVLVVHRRGTHLAYAALPDEHKAKGCRCKTCHWERQADEREGSGMVTREQAQRMRTEILTFQFGQVSKPRVEALDAEI
jgi:hypothetical protein